MRRNMTQRAHFLVHIVVESGMRNVNVLIDIKQRCVFEILFYSKILNYFYLFDGNIDNLISQINQ